LILVSFFVLSNSAIAAPHTITLPAETAKLKESILPGYMLAQQKCAICHSADYINLQPPGMTLKQWTAEVTKMQHAYGAPISEKDINLIGEYLAVTYGSEKMPAMPVATKAEAVNVTPAE
jgi:cytochrome c